MTEAKPLLFFLNRYTQNDATSLVVETDSKWLTGWVKEVCKIPRQLLHIIREIRGLLQDTNWSIQHCFREANQVADKLASLGHETHNEIIFHEFQEQPKQVSSVLIWINADIRGLIIV